MPRHGEDEVNKSSGIRWIQAAHVERHVARRVATVVAGGVPEVRWTRALDVAVGAVAGDRAVDERHGGRPEDTAGYVSGDRDVPAENTAPRCDARRAVVRDRHVH